jgi:tRNA threonylcarbamoyl adenosine modification protein (Sua5/YciO/YrdC/YwlC family)
MANARIFEIDPEHMKYRPIEQAIDVLKGGGIVAHPTDTTYALGVCMSNVKGVNELYRIKKKDLTRPLSFLCSDISNMAEYATISQEAFQIMRRLLPGPYTFILPARKSAPRKLIWSNRKEIGIRVPKDPVVQALIEGIGEPLISTSAKILGGDLLATAYDIQDDFGHSIDLIIDTGYIEPEPSTIVSFLDENPVVWRMGKGPIDDCFHMECD